MDLQQVLQVAAQLFNQGNNGPNQDDNQVASALSELMGGQADGSGIDLGQIVSSLDGAGLTQIAQSWLGDGANDPIDPGQLSNVFGQDKLGQFAQNLGMEQADVEQGLSQALPAIIDKSSQGGSLLEAVGGVSGIMGMVGKLFGKN
ncbi:YidB family protein [Ferrimonas marina]|uniref:Uncharacterized conserved protein YidB, DUF937 family n=1 Tax=Ferrimonas marina TaxID=299255 RepID=A0A1M5P4L7_9GAMM|nr:YidB family protein [Ferrimonas marina]SHG96774.1 Uncharacterized conserved protein YidB, DUF937 family [Ferrimonas marina]